MARRNSHRTRRTYEKFHGVKIPVGHHIHHIDGDKTNDSPENLLCVTPEEHYEIHLTQWEKHGNMQDLYASQMLATNIGVRRLRGYKKPEMTGENHPNWGKPAYNRGMKFGSDPERNRKISETLKKKYASGEIKATPSAFKKGHMPHNAVEVIAFGEKYKSFSECGRKLNKSKTTIKKWCLDANNENFKLWEN